MVKSNQDMEPRTDISLFLNSVVRWEEAKEFGNSPKSDLADLIMSP